MGNKIQYFLTYLLAILLLSACGVQQSQTTPKLSDMAPNFTLPDINGKPVSLQDFKGKQVVLYLWSVNCHLCMKDLAEIQSLSNCVDNSTITFLAINVSDSIKVAAEYLKVNGYSFPVLIDYDMNIWKLYALPRNSVPYTIIIDADGKIKWIEIGNSQASGGLKKLVGEKLIVTWDKTPPQISQIGISDISFGPTILNWQTDKETKSNIVLIRGDTEVTGYCLAENWTKYHRLDLADISARHDDKINIISTDYCSNSASAVVTPNTVSTHSSAYDNYCSFGSVVVNDDFSLSYPRDRITTIDFMKGSPNKYICSGIITCGTRNTAVVAWDIYIVNYPLGGAEYITAVSDEVTLDGDTRLITIPIFIDSKAPEGLYSFKIVFYKK